MELKITVTKKGPIFEGKSPEILNEALSGAIYEATQLLEGEVKKNTPAGVFGAQGGLVSAIYGEVVGKGTPVVKGIVGHQSKYGDVIEMGRRPGQKAPPEGTLIRWMEIVLGMDSATAKKKEFVIRRNIGRKGFPGVHMFESALTGNWDNLKKIFDHYGFEIARNLDGE